MQKSTARVILPLFAASFLAYGYNNIFMVLTPLFTRSIGASVTEAGLQGAVFLIVAVALRFYFGPLADRRGQKLIMALGVSAFVTGGFLFLFCTEFWQVLGVRCIQAVGLSAFFPCATALVATAVPAERVGFFLGVFRFVVSFSLLVGPLGAQVLVDGGGYALCFTVMTALAVIALILVMTLPATYGTDEGSERSGLRKLFDTLRDAMKEKPRVIVVMLGSTFVAALGYGLLFSFASLFIGEVRPSINTGLYFTLIGVGGLGANLITGWVSDKVDRVVLLTGCLICMGAGVVALGFLEGSEILFFVSGLLAGFGYAGVITTVLALASAKISDAHLTSILALQQNGIDLGIACASAGFGIVFAAGSNAPVVFIVQGVIMALVAFAVLLGNKKDLS